MPHLRLLSILMFVLLVTLQQGAQAQCQTQPRLHSYDLSLQPVGVSSQGFMFDIQNTSGTAVRITGLEQVTGPFGNYDFEIYTKPGSLVGFESNPAAWTLVGSAVVSVPLNNSLVQIPVTIDLPIAPYETRALYITTRGGTNQRLGGVSGPIGGISFGNTTASDGVVNIVCGVGKFYPFTYTLTSQVRGGGAFAGPGRSYCWNGRVTYCRSPAIAARNTILGVGCLGATPLTLTPTALPRVNSHWSHTLTNVPANGVFGVEILGLSDPGLTDLAFLGMPGCGLRAALNQVTTFTVHGPTHVQSISIPNMSSLVGVSLFASAAVFQNPPSNRFGAISANAVQGTIGNQ